MKIKEVVIESPIDWIKKKSGWNRYQNVDVGQEIKKATGWNRYQSATSATPKKQQIQRAPVFDVKKIKPVFEKIISNNRLYRSDTQLLSILLNGIKNGSIKPSTVNPSQISATIKKILDGYDLNDNDRELIKTYLKEI